MGPKITLKDISFLLFKSFFPVHLDWLSKIRGNLSIARVFVIKLCSLRNGDMAKVKNNYCFLSDSFCCSASLSSTLQFFPSKPHNKLCLIYERLAQHSIFPQVCIFPCGLGEKSCSVFNNTQTSIKESAYSSQKETGASGRVRTLTTDFSSASYPFRYGNGEIQNAIWVTSERLCRWC